MDTILNAADSLQPHRRFNPLTEEWILVSPQRAQRPWLGAEEKPAPVTQPAYDPQCYLCPGNVRAQGGNANPPYTGVYVFENDFPALLPVTPDTAPTSTHPLLRREAENGICRVICFSPRHDLSLANLSPDALRDVVNVWIAQCEELGARDDIAYVQIFENKGETMGCSNPHPHGQLWATGHVPTQLLKEQNAQQKYRAENQSSLLLDYLAIERERGERLLYENDTWAVLVPFWATWPFETIVLPKRPLHRITEMNDGDRVGLADALSNLTKRYDRLFDTSFPYSMGIHQAPFDNASHEEWQVHLHFYPPLLRSATVKKFLVGYEMLAQAQRDLTPEQAADRLRRL